MANSIRFDISEIVSAADRPLNIRLKGLLPNQQVTIRAHRPTISPTIFLESYGEFAADASGNVDLDTQAPICGTYSEVDGMGLFWSMHFAEVSNSNEAPDTTPLSPMRFTLTAHDKDEILATATLKRVWLFPTVSRVSVRENGLVATYFHHGDSNTRPGVIVFEGAQGGLHEHTAALLASHGYATLALAYYGTEYLPSDIVNIPLEYVESAIKWFVSQPGVSKEWMGVHGTSKGGELALLSASLFSEIKSVVCVASWGIIFHGIQARGSAKLPAAWTYRGQPVPYASEDNPYRAGKIAPPTSNLVSYRPWYNAHLSNEDIVSKATIPVESIHGSILFISGEQDQMLDSVRVSALSMQRLREAHHPYHFEHLVYPEAGHAIRLPYRLSTIHTQVPKVQQVTLVGGGDMYANAQASADSWERILQFFSQESKVVQF